MTVVDVALALTVATLAALGAQRRVGGLLVGLGGALALRPLLLLAALNPWLGLAGALLVGLALALVGRLVLPTTGGTSFASRLAGGLGGAALGLAVVLTLVTSLPIQRDPLNPNQLRYPPQGLPSAVRPAIERSVLVQLGREVLFAPLLIAQEPRSPQRASLISSLHDWVIVGEPWQMRPPIR
jgi:hypothetical protein